MNKKDDFYIGWKENMSDSNRKFLKRRLLPIAASLFILVALLIFFQKGFNNHSFELGKQTEVTGFYYDTPVPILVADNNSLPVGISQEILLVGYGKSGASGTMNDIQKIHADLNGKKVKLSGTLIYGDGQTIMELTSKEKSLIEVISVPSRSSEKPEPKNPIKLKGEILDPKCYFGVMKPGEGKIHKSCAIRCISGGIPPVFRHNSGDSFEYYIMLDENGQSMNHDVLEFVGEQISLEGESNEYLGWNILYCNTSSFNYL